MTKRQKTKSETSATVDDDGVSAKCEFCSERLCRFPS